LRASDGAQAVVFFDAAAHVFPLDHTLRRGPEDYQKYLQNLFEIVGEKQ